MSWAKCGFLSLVPLIILCLVLNPFDNLLEITLTLTTWLCFPQKLFGTFLSI